MDGFFVAKIKKLQNGEKIDEEQQQRKSVKEKVMKRKRQAKKAKNVQSQMVREKLNKKRSVQSAGSRPAELDLKKKREFSK